MDATSFANVLPCGSKKLAHIMKEPLRCSALFIVVGCMFSSTAFAQGAPPTIEPLAPPPTAPAAAPAGTSEPPPAARSFPKAQPHDEAGVAISPWRERYEAAREELIRGDFAAAHGDFEDLARSADNDIDRAIAQEDAELAAEWMRRDLAFVRRIDLGESHLTPKALDHRTGDELVSLYANGVLYGLGTGTWLGLVATNGYKNTNSEGLSIGLPVAMLGATEIAIALADTQAHAFRYGGAQSIVSGLYVGFEEGLVWTLFSETLESRSQMTTTVASTFIWGTSTAGAVAGGLLGRYHPTTPGRASFVGSTALWSAVLVGSFVGAVEPAESASSTYYRPYSATTPLLAAGLALNAGLVGGLLLAEPVSPMIARVRLLDLGGATGYLVGAGLYAAANRNSTTPGVVGFGALGCALGLTGMWFATRAMDDDRREVRPAPATALESISPTILPVDRGAAIGVRGVLF